MSTALLVADDIVWESLRRKQPITNLELQQIMFFLSLKYRKEKYDSLITDKSFEKWPYGPTIEIIHTLYGQKFGGEKIKYIPDFIYMVKKKNGHTLKSYPFYDFKFKPEYRKFIFNNSNGYKPKTYNFSHYDLRKDHRKFIADNLNEFIHNDGFDIVPLMQKDPEWKNKDFKFYDLQKSLVFFTKKGII